MLASLGFGFGESVEDPVIEIITGLGSLPHRYIYIYSYKPTCIRQTNSNIQSIPYTAHGVVN